MDWVHSSAELANSSVVVGSLRITRVVNSARNIVNVDLELSLFDGSSGIAPKGPENANATVVCSQVR